MTGRPEVLAGVADADLDGQTALVTGSTSGIGRETALALGRLGADVVVHGRDAEAGAAVVSELERAGTDATFVPADFADVDAVRGLARAVRARTDRLDVLCHNAGGLFREARLTDLGVEYTFHVNHLAPYLLTARLHSHLATGARVVTTASGAHRGGTLDLDAVTSVADYSAFRAYARSKLSNVLFAAELARRLREHDRDVASNAFHPGAVPGSGFTRFLPGPLSALAGALDRIPFVTTVSEGASTAVYLAVGAGGSDGRYYADCAPRTPSAAARDPDSRRRLWAESAALLDVEEPLPTG